MLRFSGPSVRSWAPAALWLVLLVHVSAFWGRGFSLFPYPLDRWPDVYFRQFAGGWREWLGPWLDDGDANAVYRACEAYLLGLLLPYIVLRVAGLRPLALGLGPPAPGSARRYVPWLLVAAVLGMVLASSTPNPWGSVVYESMELAAMLPEHFLVFGVVRAAVLSGAWSGHGAPVAPGTPESRPAPRPDSADTQQRHFVAVMLASALFAWIHIGVPWLEFLFSVPAGLLFAVLTVRTGSIWPALAVHWTLNLVPMGLMP